MEIKIVKYKDANFEDFGYAVCKCTMLDEAIEIPRPDQNDYIRFQCPRCGESLGIVLKGKFSDQYLGMSK